ncbi:MAG TPA: FAD-binding domain-containing protein, partial [Gammaproteobacteria bacterium]
GARWFWETLVDADLANNTMGWQWVAGCGVDAAPYFRIFNPDTQAERYDPQHIYLQRWLGDRLQESPPVAMVDLKLSREQALERYQRWIRRR